MFIQIFAFSIIALLLANIVIPNRERTWVKVLNVVLGIVVVASAVAVIAGFFVDVEAVLGNLLSDMGFVTPADAAQRIVDSVMDGTRVGFVLPVTALNGADDIDSSTRIIGKQNLRKTAPIWAAANGGT